MSFKDHFSGIAAAYATYRPRYPERLFDWLSEVAPAHALAWDCATGSGQAAVSLASRFARVHATDASADQISHAEARPNITYACEPAEACSLPDASVDLLTVAQALHWFDAERFFQEAERVLKPGGVIAAWCYGQFEMAEGLNEILERFYHQTVGPYWPPERQVLEAGYRTLPWPFEELEPPALKLEVDWTFASLMGYLRSWSATQRFQELEGVDPVSLIEAELAAKWGEPDRVRRVSWPIAMRVGRKAVSR
ncbi:MAG TPA: class I SAM-dependent methyltransferase [Pantanalinema sp.]